MTRFEQELNDLMSELEGKEKILDHQTRKLFNLHNEHYKDIQEWTVSCAACRKRVYTRMKSLWESSIKNKTSK